MGGQGATAGPGVLRVRSPPAGEKRQWGRRRGTINVAVAGHERSASLKAKEVVELKRSTTDSTGRPSSATLSSASSSDEDSGSGGGAQESHTQSEPLFVSLANFLPIAPRAPASASQTSEGSVFTVMIRQIPRHYTQLKFLAKVSCSGFHGLVDFIYFPFDPKKGMNVGYGFINFAEPWHTAMFQQEFDDVYLDMEMRGKKKPLRMHPAAVQGFEDNLSHFMTKKTDQKADQRHSPLFMPRGSWASLSEDVQVELMNFREAFTSTPPGLLEVARGEAPGLMLGLSQHSAGMRKSTSEEPWRTGFPSTSELESRAVTQRDLCAQAQARGRGLRAGALEDGGGREEHTPSAPTPWGRHPAKISPLGQLRPPPGLQPARSPARGTARGNTRAAPDGVCPSWPPRAPQEPWSLKLGGLAPRRPPPPEGQFWSTGEPAPLWSHRSSPQPAAPSVPTAPFEGLLGTYQQLEERRQKLLNELVAVQDEQRRTIVSAPGVRPPLPSAASQLDSHS